jgi:hypothetical protein
VASLPLSEPPELGPHAKYPEYKDWLRENFHLDLCSFCLQQHENALSIDHYVPRNHDSSRLHDPTNLLLSCPTCGRQKSDYHPAHQQRRRRPHDQTGFSVLDVRCDDLARMFVLRDDGSLALHPDSNKSERDRAAWNVALFRLDLHDKHRARLLEKLMLVEALRSELDPPMTVREQKLLDVLEPELVERLPMIRAFDLPLSPALLERLESAKEKAIRARVTGL